MFGVRRTASLCCDSVASSLWWFAAIVILWCCTNNVHSTPSKKPAFIDDNVQNYLTTFGYLPQSDLEVGNLRTVGQLTDAIKNMQKFGGLKQTGVLDEATVKLMRKPRCGLPDQPTTDSFRSRRKRFTLHPQRWKHTNLTWSLRSKTIPNLTVGDVRRELFNALDVWSKHSKLTFQEINSDNADILVYFESGYHGDGYNFDGRGQILAHAFFPGTGRGGDAHFDADEAWLTAPSDNEDDGTSLFMVAAHEFGHSLGLSHSSVEGSLMYPWYQGISTRDFELPDDDRLGIQQIYGSREDKMWANIPTTTTTTPKPTDRRRPGERYPDQRYPDTRYPDPKYPDRRYPDNRYPDTRYPDPRYPVTRHPDSRYPDPRYPDPRYPDTKYPDPRYPDPRYPDPRYPDPRYPDPRYPNPRYPDPRQPDVPRQRPEQPPEEPVTPAPRPRPTARPVTTTTTTTTTTVRARYPQREHTTRPTSPPPTRGGQHHHHHHRHRHEHKPPDKCNTTYDAVALIRKELFIFKDQYLWRIGDSGMYDGYPAQIIRMFNNLPNNFTHVDAVYERPDQKIVFFIGNMYYVYNSNYLESGYPQPLTTLGLPESLEKIDAAMVWGHNGKTYLYSGTMYWRLDEETGKVELDYPRDMSMWKGVGYNIDSVFQWNDGKTYFFKGKGYWKFNDQYMRVEKERQQPSAHFWMKCPVTHSGTVVAQRLDYSVSAAVPSATSTLYSALFLLIGLVAFK